MKIMASASGLLAILGVRTPTVIASASATLLLSLVVNSLAYAQLSTVRLEGLREHAPNWHAIVGAKLMISPSQTLDNATVVMREGKIVAVGHNLAAPEGAKIWDAKGKMVYAGFIDMASNLGVPANLQANAATTTPNRNATPTGRRSFIGRALSVDNPKVHPEQIIANQLDLKSEDIKAARELGFTTVLAAPSSGIFRGQSALVNLSENTNAKNAVIDNQVAQHMAHDLEFSGRGVYPNSLMGAIALVRQILYDAQWYVKAMSQKNGERPQINESLASLKDVIHGKQPVIYVADNEQAYQRIAKIRDEFKLKVILQGNGYEYRRTPQIKQLGMSVIVPLAYPNAPEIDHPDMALDTSLESLQHWEQAPSNLSMLEKSGIEIAITTNGLKNPKTDFWLRLRQAIKRGLSVQTALASLTTTPAKLLGEQNRLGTISVGQMANLIVANGDLFKDDKANIEVSFVEGKPYTTENFNKFDVRGTWHVKYKDITTSWTIAGTVAKPSLSIEGKTTEIIFKDKQLVVKIFDKGAENNPDNAQVIVADVVKDGAKDKLSGTWHDASAHDVSKRDAAAYMFSAVKTANTPEADKPSVKTEAPVSTWNGAYPAGPFAFTAPLSPKAILIKNATIWTSSKAGKLDHTDILVIDGKISQIGQNIAAPVNAHIIDATGKHITAGLIDAHSHLAMMQGTNEASSIVTAEVRVGDIIDASSINIYRQLAGGLTTANVLHGSANVIGGQSQTLRLRWGQDAEGLKFDHAIPGIKFALGENPKQSNWGSDSTGRYPQTRMGVEQLLRSVFFAAREYKQEYEAWKKNSNGKIEPRRDLQMETLVELLDRKRVIHIHSYRQDEILMFIRVAQEFNLNVATFQHVMEGYKVAPEIASINAGASTFTDWWGYKIEVADSIPHNAAMMHKAGVLTTFNSDSDELARHLNTEAAKGVKYGGLSEEEALNFVTINSAKQLHIDHKVGSLEIGKDADFVVWSGHPLSTYTKAEQTWIEGKRYFDIHQDKNLRAEAHSERNRIVAKILQDRKNISDAGAMNNSTNSKPEIKVSTPKTTQEINEANQHYVELMAWIKNRSQRKTGYWAGEEGHECTEGHQH